MSAPRRTAEQIKADNAKFKKLSQPRKRVAIARDALAQLGTRLTASAGRWVQFRKLLPELAPETQVQDILNKTPECDVCAKGALFVCLVDRVNDLTLASAPITPRLFGDVSHIKGQATDSYLRRLFSDNQLNLIEIAFESESYAMHSGITPNNTFQEKMDARTFFYTFGQDKDAKSSEVRLRAILENIIANNGTFKPEILPVQKWVTPGFRG